MTEPVGKAHAHQTQKQWTSALRNPDPHGAFVAYLCDILQAYADRRCELDAETQTEVARRAKALKLNPLHVWNAVVMLAHALGRKIG